MWAWYWTGHGTGGPALYWEWVTIDDLRRRMERWTPLTLEQRSLNENLRRIYVISGDVRNYVSSEELRAWEKGHEWCDCLLIITRSTSLKVELDAAESAIKDAHLELARKEHHQGRRRVSYYGWYGDGRAEPPRTESPLGWRERASPPRKPPP